MVKNSSERYKAIVLFDGECNFCNATVLFMIKHDKEDNLCFASQQSDVGIKLMQENDCNYNALNTIIFIKENKVSVKTDAIIEIGKLLNGYPKWIIILKIIPQVIRDYCYDIFSKRRYRLFGKRDNCLIPTQEIRNKFID